MGNRIRKLTDKIKYRFNDDGTATIYLVRLDTGKWERFADCHAATLEQIRKLGMSANLHLLSL